MAYTYTKHTNLLTEGGLTRDIAEHILAVGGPELLERVLSLMGRGIARVLHTDVLESYLKSQGLSPNPALVEGLQTRGVVLPGIPKDRLEMLVLEMPKEGGDEELLGQANALIEQLDAELTQARKQYAELRANYAQTLTAIAGRGVQSLAPILKETVSLLRGTEPHANPEEVARLQREIDGYRRQAAEDQTILRKKERSLQEALARCTMYEAGRRDLTERVKSLSQILEQSNQRLEEERHHHDATRLRSSTIQSAYETLLEQHTELRGRTVILERQLQGAGIVVGPSSLTLSEVNISRYHANITRQPNNPLLYTLVLYEIMDKTHGNLSDGEAEYARYCIFHLERLGATFQAIDLAGLYASQRSFAAAEFILGKLVEDGSTEQRVYTTLAEIVRTQNTGTAHSLQREEWAKWLDWKAQEVYKGQLERRYQERLQPLQEAIRRNSDDAEPYIQTLQALFEKNESRAPQGEEAEFGRYNLYHAVRLGQTSRLVQWAQSFYDQGHSESAEFILDKIVKEDSRDSQAYTLLAQIVRAQNIGTAHSLQREEWAKWLDWKAREVQ